MRKKLLRLSSLIIFVFIFLAYRVFKVQQNMMEKDNKSNIQKEIISDSKGLLLDEKGENLLDYKKEYYLVIDEKPFRLNDPRTFLDDLLAFSYIVKSDNPDFSLEEIFKNGEKEYIKISENTYYKLKEIKNIKGIYTFSKDVTEKKEAWKIENLLGNYYNEVEDKGKIKKDLKPLGTLERTIYEYIKDNEFPNVKFSLDNNAIYTLSKIDDESKNINIKTTLDNQWQSKIREVLNDPKYSNLENAGVVLVESKTGKIKALAQKDEKQVNILLGGTYGYEPGSIFKILTAELALEEGIIKENEKIYCDGKNCFRNGKSHAHGSIDLETAMKVSCNVFFQKLAMKIGYNDLYNFAKNQGVFSKVLGFQDERIGEADLNGGVTNFSIGQSIVTTPLQMVSLLSTVVNDGTYVKPYIIDSILDEDNNTVKVFSSEDNKKVINEQTARKVKKDMKAVVETGSGYNAKIKGIDIGGKTGTANGNNKDYGTFLGYFNIENQYYNMMVFVPGIEGKNAEGEEMVGGNTAAPIFKDVISSITKK
ncbi:peptidoglycan D,D-transpeptidase FtsI family protein [Clostridium fallax]|uniref:Cell division protein FtsI/penicillin-binding protein 2 n=1 Tax=Clostridium fallax TaxID=1533 RepID=A0A1M4X7M9_9CLOT|nr:penicillin-binding transpeptidase domain-containing protein [Clostridium fallax]SHE89415.1 Cell division protein FtsI/penicillin-binding protein 2 [Clostridium fallax]SQB07343.1 cell division protein FtsI/penicillin-binding protein 2 [Clostridium fallax]